MRNERQPIVSTVVQRSLPHALCVVGVLALTCARVNADSISRRPLCDEVRVADAIVVGTGREAADSHFFTIDVSEVIKGDAATKNFEVRCGVGEDGLALGFGIWLLKDTRQKDRGQRERALFETINLNGTCYPEDFKPLVKLLVAGKEDDSVLDLFGTSESVDMEIVEYASSINLKSPAAIKTASRALASSYWSCRLDAANWLATAVTTPADAKTALPALIGAASRTEEINNKGGNASARAQAYEAIRGILHRMGVSEAEKLPGWRGDDEAVKLRLRSGVHVTSPIARKLEESAKETERTEAEAAIRRACDLAQQFLRAAETKPHIEGR